MTVPGRARGEKRPADTPYPAYEYANLSLGYRPCLDPQLWAHLLLGYDLEMQENEQWEKEFLQ